MSVCSKWGVVLVMTTSCGYTEYVKFSLKHYARDVVVILLFAMFICLSFTYLFICFGVNYL